MEEVVRMPEVVKQYLTVHDLKLALTLISVMGAGFLAWSQVQSELTELRVRNEVEAERSSEQSDAIKELTRAVQALNVTNAKLGQQLESLEKIIPRGKPIE